MNKISILIDGEEVEFEGDVNGMIPIFAKMAADPLATPRMRFTAANYLCETSPHPDAVLGIENALLSEWNPFIQKMLVLGLLKVNRN